MQIRNVLVLLCFFGCVSSLLMNRDAASLTNARQFWNLGIQGIIDEILSDHGFYFDIGKDVKVCVLDTGISKEISHSFPNLVDVVDFTNENGQNSLLDHAAAILGVLFHE